VTSELVSQPRTTGQHRLVTVACRLDVSGEWAFDGARTCAHWIARVLDVEVCTAREWLRIGHALAELDVIEEAFASGRLSYSKVRTLTRVATVGNQREVCDLAERVAAGRLAVAFAAWLGRRESPDETDDRQRQNRALWWRVDPDGMVDGAFRLPPARAAVLLAAVDAAVMRQQSPAVMEGGERASAGASTPRTVVRWPSIAQQRADALVDLVSSGGASLVTEVVLHVRADGCSLDDGTPVTDSVVERIAPKSFLRALIHDAESRPINASGRQRHPTQRQRRVVRERDRVCVECGDPEFSEYDHEPDFDLTRHTVVDELRLR
jgi:hypothetical protein